MARALEEKTNRPSSSRKTSERDNSNGRIPALSVDLPSDSESSPEPSRGKKLSSSANEGKSSKVGKRSPHRSRKHRSRRSVSSESDAAPARKRRSEDGISSDASDKVRHRHRTRSSSDSDHHRSSRRHHRSEHRKSKKRRRSK
ncbi:hypothetical protein ANCDUO_19389 [Ancylostoma duodenale]|uniref:Uncharacterized protein n=1 Tax=Ancylostoma duodenale TaxID=51022 RepID=A0A0C2CL53_9BILA|nr:hypothetical protein ANCDUO_19389 [Ancylostoma duodenale]